MFVKPKKGLKILRPDTNTVLMECGEDVPKTGFWLRRVKMGDVSVVDLAKKSEPVAVVKPKAEEVKKPKDKKQKQLTED